jgi:hypothetical protein
MKSKYAIVILILFLLIPVIALHGVLVSQPKQDLDIFVGVDVAYDNVEEIKALVDEISAYTNTIVIGSIGITYDLQKLNDVCQYVYEKGMYFIIYKVHPLNDDLEDLAVQRQWVHEAKPMWGKYFLGLYAYDETGGRQLDDAEYQVVHNWNADNLTDAANKYVSGLDMILNHTIRELLGAENVPLYTSDYALYWFDYKGGYDVVFAEFGWNYSRQLNVALCRGAANVLNRDWGAMITWTYTQPPDHKSYLESGDRLYDDLVLAYENGAKYILVFDSNENYTHGTLQPEHKDALKRFWQYAADNPRPSEPPSDRMAYVLPKDYGYGFRGPDDTVWGLWAGHEYDFSFEISTQVGGLLGEYPNRVDMIYDDGLEPGNSYGYSELIFWNGTVIQ